MFMLNDFVVACMFFNCSISNHSFNYFKLQLIVGCNVLAELRHDLSVIVLNEVSLFAQSLFQLKFRCEDWLEFADLLYQVFTKKSRINLKFKICGGTRKSRLDNSDAP